jgi:carbon-monoxide dehydrogenase medium subunit
MSTGIEKAVRVGKNYISGEFVEPENSEYVEVENPGAGEIIAKSPLSTATGGFRLARPETLDEVVRLLDEYGDRAALLSGGTDLLVQLRAGKINPRIVIDLKLVRSLSSKIVEEDSFLRIGCLTLLSDIVADAHVRNSFPVLADAAATVGSVQIRNRATLAGNVCNASPAADTVPALLIHNAVVELADGEASRSVPLKDFFVGPGKTIRRQKEIVTAVRLPKPTESNGTAFDRLTRRRGMDLATINVACMAEASGTVRFAYGAVGPTPLVVEDESGRLSSHALDDEERNQLLANLIEKTAPISDVRAGKDYRTAMLMVYSRRTLETALGRLSRDEGEV